MITRLKLLAAILSFFCLLPCVHAADEVVPINLYVGEVRTLPLSKIQRVAVGNGKLITANVLENELLLLAEAPGRTSLFVWTTDGKQSMFDVNVSASDGASTQKRLTTLLTTMPGLTVERAGDSVIVTGTATKANLSRIDAIVKLFPQTLNLVREEEVTMKRMIYMKVQIVEMKKSLSENIGVAWDQTANGPAAGFAGDLANNNLFRIPTTPPANFPSPLPLTVQSFRPYLGITTAITSRINLAVNNGDAYVLATPELSTRSGGEAKFLAGGQIPLITPATAFAPATITYKDYGIKLSISPVADDKGNVTTLIKTEVSSIDNSVAVQGNPGFLTRATDSEVNVQAGQTIVISGLVNSELAKDVTRVPGLSNIPILGALFRSTQFRNNRTDLVIFVTPIVTDPSSTLNRERLEKAQDMQDKFQRQLGPKGIVD
ncbi:MAG: pilus assembly protein N-terminal domain-containing protein [Betaproteobacteria bacterium]|nr:pilus assembly protein N-terminal domain-containing protein [Betaproteobacteria bacterium]